MSTAGGAVSRVCVCFRYSGLWLAVRVSVVFAVLFGVACSSCVVRGGVVGCAVGGFVVQCRGFGGLSVLFPSSRVSWLFCVVVCWV